MFSVEFGKINRIFLIFSVSELFGNSSWINFFRVENNGLGGEDSISKSFAAENFFHYSKFNTSIFSTFLICSIKSKMIFFNYSRNSIIRILRYLNGDKLYANVTLSECSHEMLLCFVDICLIVANIRRAWKRSSSNHLPRYITDPLPHSQFKFPVTGTPDILLLNQGLKEPRGVWWGARGTIIFIDFSNELTNSKDINNLLSEFR